MFCDWGFNLKRGEDILKKWQTIPTDIDILMTHGPPVGKGLLLTVHDYICSAPEILNHRYTLVLVVDICVEFLPSSGLLGL